MNTEVELSAAVIAAHCRDWAQTMASGRRACDLRVQLGRQPMVPVELDRGARRRRRDGDGANRYGRGEFQHFGRNLCQRGNRVVTNKQFGHLPYACCSSGLVPFGAHADVGIQASQKKAMCRSAVGESDRGVKPRRLSHALDNGSAGMR